MNIFHCTNGCCTLYQKQGVSRYKHNTLWKHNRKKAGAFIYNEESRKVLLVQSHFKKWGSPKGSIEQCDDKSILQCAIREVYEETGIRITEPMLRYKRPFRIGNTFYFYIQTDIQENFSQIEDDITGITWIRIECLDGLDLNIHTKRCIRKFVKNIES